MKAAAAVISLLQVAWLLVACGAPPAPSTPAGPPPEIVFTTDSAGAHHIVPVRAGGTTRDLPAGALAVRLTGGGDVGEAYVVASAGSHARVLRLIPSRGFATEVVADQAGPGDPQAVLVPAPQLAHFVGSQTVLVVRFGDGRLAGYQAGTQIWSVAHPTIAGNAVTHLVGLGGAAAVGDGVAAWGVLVTETGEIKPVAGCEAGPLAAIGTAVVFSCRGELDTVPSLGPPAPVGQLVGVPWTLPTPEGGVLMVWPGGDFLRLDRHAATTQKGRLPAPNSRPLLTPDGARLFVATDAGILGLDLATQRSNQLVHEAAIDSIGLSRDGNFIYALSAGRLEVFSASSGNRLASHPAVGTEIELVAGG